jgi:hypothetical protein
MKTRIIAVGLFILLALPLAYFASSITGFATQEPENKATYGKYSIKPDFKVKMTQTLEPYAKLRLDARAMVPKAQACEASSGLASCVKSNLPDSWSMQCGTYEEQALSKFAEDYMLCSESQDNYCLCEASFDILAKPERQEYTFTFEESNSGTLFNSGDVSYYYEKAYPDVYKNTESGAGTMGKFEVRRKFQDYGYADNPEVPGTPPQVGEVPIVDSAKVTITRANLPLIEVDARDKSLNFYKIDKAMIFASANQLPEARKCKLPNKRIFKLCSAGVNMYVDDKGVGAHRQVFNFAIDFSDNEPPLHATVKAEDAQGAAGTLLISWSASASDISHYNVYISKSEIKSVKDMQPVAFVKETSISMSQYPEKDKMVNIDDGIVYYVAVLPVDKSNNQLFDVMQQVQAISTSN